MDDVTRLREQNTAGGCKIQIVPVALVDTVPPEYFGGISSDITLLSGGWTLIEPTRFTQQFSEAWTRIMGAQMADASVAAVIPKDRVSLLWNLWHLHGDRYLVLVHDHNGTIKLMGTKEEPAIVRIEELTHGRDPRGDRNQYQLVCEVSRRSACPFYLADAPLVVGAVAPELPVDPETVGRARVGTTAPISLVSAPATIDGVTLDVDDRVLVMDQAAPEQNGVYVWNGAGEAMTRSLDYNAFNYLANGLVLVDQGTANADTMWYCTSNAGGTLNTTAVNYIQFGGSPGTYTADEDTLQLVGSEFSVKDAELLAIAALTSAANMIPRFTGPGAADLVELDLDNTLAADSDDKIATQKATKAYVDNNIVTDHGALTGLGNDDHTQYHNDARGDARYSLLAHTHVVGNITDMSADARLFNQAANDAAMRTELGLGSAAVENAATTSAAGVVVKSLPSGKIDTSFIPDSVLGQLEYQGTWNATTNSPAIPAAATGNKGFYYVVSVAVAAGHGHANIANIAYDVGDWLVSNGTTWDKIDNTDAVSSVFGRLGAVVAANGDYSAGQITNDSGVVGAHVKAALNTLDAGKQPLEATLTALAALSSSLGLVEQTAPDVFGIRRIGVAAGTDVPTRADGDARWETKDADLTAIAALTPTNDDVMQRKAGAWVNRTINQLKTDLAYGALAAQGDGDKGDITVSSSGAAWAIDNDVVTNAKAADMAAATIKLRAVGAGTGDPTDGTPDQAMTILDTATDPPLRSSEILTAVLGSDFVTASASYTNVTGLSLTLAANTTYMLYIAGAYQCAGTTTGIGVSVTMTNSPSPRTLLRTINTADTTVANARINADDDGVAGTTVGTANSDHSFIIRGMVKTGGSPCVVQLRVIRGGTNVNVTIQDGSYMLANKI